MLETIASVGWPVLDRFRFGDSIAISPHGLGIAIGFMTGAWLFTKLSARRGIPEGLASSIVFWSVVGSLVGARVAYVIAHVSEFASPLDWFRIWEGGISLLGGIAGATIANAVNIRRQEYRFRFFQVADTIAPVPRAGHLDRADRGPDHRRPPRQADVLVPCVDLRGRHARAAVLVCR